LLDYLYCNFFVRESFFFPSPPSFSTSKGLQAVADQLLKEPPLHHALRQLDPFCFQILIQIKIRCFLLLIVACSEPVWFSSGNANHRERVSHITSSVLKERRTARSPSTINLTPRDFDAQNFSTSSYIWGKLTIFLVLFLLSPWRLALLAFFSFLDHQSDARHQHKGEHIAQQSSLSSCRVPGLRLLLLAKRS